MHRLILCALAFVVCLFLTLDADATVDPCTVEAGDVVCPQERYQLLRDKARGFQVICDAVEVGTLSVALPTRLQAVCQSAGITSTIWARARKWQAQRDAAQLEKQRADRCEGSLAHSEEMAARCEGERDAARAHARRWKVVSIVGWSVAALVGAGWGCQVAKWCPVGE